MIITNPVSDTTVGEMGCWIFSFVPFVPPPARRAWARCGELQDASAAGMVLWGAETECEQQPRKRRVKKKKNTDKLRTEKRHPSDVILYTHAHA